MKKIFVISILTLVSNGTINGQTENNFDILYQKFKNDQTQHLNKIRFDDSVKYYKLDINKLNQYVFAELNAVKKLNNLPLVTLQTNDSLVSKCNEFAEYLVINDVLGHAGTGYDAEICQAAIVSLNRDLKNDNESEIYSNLAKSLLDGWMNSEKHKMIILNKSYTKVIVSTAKDDLNQSLQGVCGFDLRGIIRFYK
jgi:uncharacterized protein YkwD